MYKLFRLVLIMLFFFSSVLQALSSGDLIENTANINYKVHGVNKEALSNTTSHIVDESDAEVSFLYAGESNSQESVLGATAYYDENGVLQVSETSTLTNGVVLGDNSPVSLEDTGVYGLHDTVIVRVSDADQNINRDIRDYLEVTITADNGDTEILRLIETGENTGVFLGYIPLSNTDKESYDDQLYVEAGETILANYNNQITEVKSDSAVVVEKQVFKVWLEKLVNKEEASIGELLTYTLRVHNDEGFSVRNMILNDALPMGLKYQSSTAKFNGLPINSNISANGKNITFKLPDLVAYSKNEITFLASVTAGVENGKVSNEAWLKYGDIFKSNVAIATTKIKEELMRSKGIIVGQVYNVNSDKKKTLKGIAGVRLYLENGTYVVTDINGKYHFEGVEVGRHIVQVDKALLPNGYIMEQCQENARFAGKNFSQFVNIGHGALKRVNFCLKSIQKREENKNIEEKKKFVIPTHVKEMPAYGKKDLNRGEKRTILWPPKGHVPFIPSVKIAIKYPKQEHIDVWLNGYRVSKMNYDGKVKSKKSNNTIELYRGVDLLERGNVIKVEYFDKDNKLLETQERNIHVSSVPVQAQYIKERSHVIANGQESPVIAVKFLDDSGKPLRAGVIGTFSVEAPYASQDVLDQLQNNPLTRDNVESKYIIHSDGTAYIKLQPTTQSGEVTLHFKLQGRDEVIRAWLKPALREWIMVGFAEGTVGYNTLKGNKESLKNIGAKEGVIKEGRVSFFAKGKVKGDWLLSMAYDSGKDTENTKLFDEIDPNKYYTLYGDNTQQYQEASSRKKLYIKVEKEQFNILLGDFNTDMSYTELSAYSRSFTGVKSEYHGDYLEAKVFATHTEQLFVKDELRGDGTSGYYYLKSNNIVNFTEKITIEVRNRYRKEEIIESISLQRFKDYEINYALGRIYFNEPIFSNDENFNPRYIVVDYEVKSDGGKYYTYGGRTAVKTKKNNIEVGVSYINEDSGKKSSILQGSDIRIKLGTNTEVRAEYAQTKTEQEAVTTKGEAKLAEIEHIGNGIHTRAYYREQDAAFGLGQLNEDLGATRKIGIDFSQQFDNRQSHQLSIYRESDLLNNSDSDVLEFRTQMEQQEWNIFAGYRYSKESFNDMAQQILVGASYRFFNQRLKLSATHDQTISSDESNLFPTKTGMGIEYALSSSIDLFSNYEWTTNAEQGRVGVRFRPWSGMTIENSTLSEKSNDSENIYNTLGSVQSFQLTPEIGINLGFEQGNMIESNLTDTDRSFNAYRLGMNYNEEQYAITFSGEVRKSRDEDKINVTSSIYSQATDSLALALSGNYSYMKGRDHKIGTEEKKSDTNLRFSLVSRPKGKGMIVLEKLDYISSNQEQNSEEILTTKLVNNLNVNLTPTDKSEVSLQHGVKYVENTVDSFEYKGFTQLMGIDARYDIQKSWELGIQGSWLYAQSAKNSDFGLGIYSGHNLFDNMLLTLGYNWKGFEDQDFSLQTYRMEGPYFRFNMKYDQESLKDIARVMSW